MRAIGARVQWLLPARFGALIAIGALGVIVGCGNNGLDLGGADAGEPAMDAATAEDAGTVHGGGDAATPKHDAGGETTRDGSSSVDSATGAEASAAPPEAGAEAGSELTGPIYTFGTAINPGSCLDVVQSGTADGTQIDEYTCNTTGAQV